MAKKLAKPKGWLHSFLVVTFPDEAFLVADGFDDAFVGINQGYGGGQLVYDRAKCIRILQKNGIKDLEEAEEYFEFNTAGAYVGKLTPVFVEVLKRPKA